MGLPDDRLVNIFRIATDDLEARIEDLPAVHDAAVTATLPDSVSVSVVERRPLLVWRTGAGAWLVDADGRLFAPTSAISAAELGTGATGTALPAVDDRRAGTGAGLGATLAPLDLEVVRLLLTVTPAMVRSAAPALYLSVDDPSGYVLEAPGEWTAAFGPYTPVLRPAEVIPRQVQCLDALLGGREETVATVTLALSDEACGTFGSRPPRATPREDREDREDEGGRRGGPDATRRP
jgi:hypothetical protein